MKEPRFVDIGDRGRNKENCNVKPIGGSADHAVIGVKKNGDQDHPEEDAAELHAPKIFALAKEKALHDRKNEHRPKE